MSVGRAIAAVLTLAFGLLAIPFLVLTTVHLLSGGVASSGTLVTFGVYVVGLVAVVVFWIRTTRRRSSG